MPVLTGIMTSFAHWFELKRSFHSLARRLHQRRDRLRLEVMSDSQLRDIGVDRGRIEHTLRVGRNDATAGRSRIFLHV